MAPSQTVEFLRALSRLMGWIYTLSWSASFYPQLIVNWRRKSTYGLTVDFPYLNVVGFTAYTISQTCLLCSPVIRTQYAARHPSAPVPTVQFNDVAYAVHALILVTLYYSQFFRCIWRFEVSELQRVSRPVHVLSGLCLAAMCTVFIKVVHDNGWSYQDPDRWAWIDVISTTGYIKLVVTFFKYIPQAWYNYQRQSTAGWSIVPILLDLLGGVLSLLQLSIDASLQHDWKDVIDNPAKLGLGYISCGFDVVFILQHYLLYPRSSESVQKILEEEDHDRQPLLGRTTDRPP